MNRIHAFAAGIILIVGIGCPAHLQTIMPGNLVVGGLYRLYCVDHPACTIYRSEQPSAADFSALVAQLGLRSVVKLNSAIEGRDQVPGGVERFEHPILPAGPADHEDLAAALWDLEQAPKPALIHCTHGVDRTGLLVALYRVKVQHVLPSQAWAEWLAFGRDTSLWMLSETFERETGWHP